MAAKPGTNVAATAPGRPQELSTLDGTKTTLARCPYLIDDQPHVFIVLAYAPGQVLQVTCQHCLLLTSFKLSIADPRDTTVN